MSKEDDKNISDIQKMYQRYDQAHKFVENILPFPVALSAVGHSILDDVEHLLKCADHREMIEETFLCTLQQIATNIIEHRRNSDG